jgi:predicted TIM-barrel fold metal-dependent hydrolase
MRVIDVHAHLGQDYTFDHDFRRESLVEELEKMGVDALVVQPGTTHDVETAREQHDAIATLAKAYPGRVFGMANPSPHLRPDVYEAEVTRCVRELGFVAVKMHPLAHAVGPDLQAGRLVVAVAGKLGIPVMIHTGSGIPFALPSAVIPLAKRNPETKIVLAHSGGPMFSGEALLAAELCPNVYLETSWVSYDRVTDYCRTIDVRRVMMGADHAGNVPVEIAKLRAASITEEDLEWCLGRTAAEFFGLPV